MDGRHQVGRQIDYTRAVPLFMSEIEQMGGAERSILALGRWLHRRGVPSYLLTYRDAAGMAAHAAFPLPTVQMLPGEGLASGSLASGSLVSGSLVSGSLVSGSLVSKLAALRRYRMQLPAISVPPIVSGYQPALHLSLIGGGRFHCLMHDTAALFSEPATRDWKQQLRIRISDRIIGHGMRRGGGTMIVTSSFLQRESERDYGVQAEIARMGGLGSPDAFRRRPLNGKLRMLSVCRIEANKRIDWILRALAGLERAQPALSTGLDWTLTLAGKGSALEAMRRLSEDLGLGQRVDFRGYVSDAELETLYDQAHLFLMPAVQGYGIPAIEALQRGIPVLLHRESGVSDILLDTPWAAVLESGEDELQPRLGFMIQWLQGDGQITAAPPPSLPTENTWAERIATLCGYV